MALTPTLPVPSHQAQAKAAGGNTVAAPFHLPHILELWHLASLDAPTVAITWTLAFAQASNVLLPWWLPTILGLSAWAFYIFDRLLDARPRFLLFPVPYSLSPALQPRHLHHWKHRRLLLPAAILATLTALALVLLKMPLRAQTRNSVLALASLAYLTSVHIRPNFKIPKELLVAIVFTTACTLPVLARTPDSLALIPAAIAFTALAWLNCQAIETWESITPAKSTRLTIPKVAIALAITTLAAATLTALSHQSRPAFLLASAAASALLIALLDKLKPHLTPTTLRTAADLALLTPLALLLR